MDVRANLWECLSYLSSTARDELFWIDAMCIDQCNVRERNEQVRAMKMTYREAAKVFVWLQDAAPESLRKSPSPSVSAQRDKKDSIRTEKTYLEKAYAEQLFPAHVEGTIWQSHFDEIMNQPYWSRTWVIQEFMLAQNITLCFGGSEIHWQDFFRVVSEVAMKHDDAAFAASNGPFPLLESRDHPSYVERPRSLFDLLQMYHKSKCSDPRDRVFALMGLLPKDERQSLERFFPDYSLSHDAVVLVTLAHLRAYGHEIDHWNSHELFEALAVSSPSKRQCFLMSAGAFDYRQDRFDQAVNPAAAYGLDLVGVDSGLHTSPNYPWISTATRVMVVVLLLMLVQWPRESFKLLATVVRLDKVYHNSS